MKYIIATHNAHKLQEISRILEPLGIEAVTDRQLGIELPEADETSSLYSVWIESTIKISGCRD